MYEGYMKYPMASLHAEKIVKLGDRLVGRGQSAFIICEGGVTNYGEFELAKRQVDAAYAAHADAIKFQAQSTERLVSRAVAKRLAPELGYDWYARMKYKEMSRDELRELKRYAETGGMPFFAAAHEAESLEFLDKELAVPFLKVGSGESHNFEFLKDVGSRGKPVLVSFGLQSDDEMMKAIETLRSAGAPGIVALHCTTLYPTPYTLVDLPRMRRLAELTGLPVGISDHSVGWHAVLGAVALGACVVEKHLTFDKDDPRSLDNPGALLPGEWKKMVREIRELEEALRAVPETERLEKLKEGRDWAGQSIVAARDISAGTVITPDLMVCKRPARGGLPPSAMSSVVGRRARVAIEEDEQIRYEQLD